MPVSPKSQATPGVARSETDPETNDVNRYVNQSLKVELDNIRSNLELIRPYVIATDDMETNAIAPVNPHRLNSLLAELNTEEDSLASDMIRGDFIALIRFQSVVIDVLFPDSTTVAPIGGSTAVAERSGAILHHLYNKTKAQGVGTLETLAKAIKNVHEGCERVNSFIGSLSPGTIEAWRNEYQQYCDTLPNGFTPIGDVDHADFQSRIATSLDQQITDISFELQAIYEVGSGSDVVAESESIIAESTHVTPLSFIESLASNWDSNDTVDEAEQKLRNRYHRAYAMKQDLVRLFPPSLVLPGNSLYSTPDVSDEQDEEDVPRGGNSNMSQGVVIV